MLPWVVSARGERGLREQATRLREHVRAAPDLDAVDVGRSLAAGRAALEHRAVVLGGDRESLLDGLRALSGGERAAGVVEGVAADGGGERVAFLFTGQGAQRVGMGRELYGAFALFREAFDEVCGELDAALGCSLREVVFGEGEPGTRGGTGKSPPADSSSGGELLERTELAQPGLFALEVGLLRLLEGWGVRPDYVAGHSVGELTAAYAAGVLSLKDACRLVAARGRLMGALPAGGAMVSVQASEEEVLKTLAGLEDRVALAAVNGPSAVVLSGDEDAVLRLAGVWEERGRKTRRLRVSHAFHSPRMDGMLEEFAQIVRQLSFAEPTIPVVSNVTGEVLAPERICDPGYWVAHVRQTVRFAASVRWLHAHGVGSFLELGPDGVLSAMVADCLSNEAPAADLRDASANGSAGHAPGGREEPHVTAIPLLRRGRGEVQTLMDGVASAWTHGVDVEWARLFEGRDARPVDLPTYAFQRQRYWLEHSAHDAGDLAAVGQAAAGHPLLGAAVAMAESEGRLFTGRLSLRVHPWLADHGVMGGVLMPGTAFLELALHAGGELGCERVQELTLHTPLLLEGEQEVQLQVAVGPAEETGRRQLNVYSRPQAELGSLEPPDGSAAWTHHAEGVLAPAEPQTVSTEPAAGVRLSAAQAWPPADAEPVDVSDLYTHLAERGLDYGPVFQGLRAAWRRGEEVFAEVSLMEDDAARAGLYCLHPALLDAALHAAMLAAPSFAEGSVHLPFSWSEVSLRTRGACSLRVCLSPAGADAVSLALSDETGAPVATVASLALRPLSTGALGLGGARDVQRESLYRVEWVPFDAGAAAEVADDERLLVGDADPAAVIDRSEIGQQADAPAAVRAGVLRALQAVQAWLADERSAESRLVVITRGAVAAREGETVSDLIGGAVWGLVRSAQSEHPGRFVLVDLDGEESSREALATAAAVTGDRSESGQQVAIRGGALLVPRLARLGVDAALRAPEGVAQWRLGVGAGGTFEELALVRSPEAGAPLQPGQVRVGAGRGGELPRRADRAGCVPG